MKNIYKYTLIFIFIVLSGNAFADPQCNQLPQRIGDYPIIWQYSSEINSCYTKSAPCDLRADIGSPFQLTVWGPGAQLLFSNKFTNLDEVLEAANKQGGEVQKKYIGCMDSHSHR